MDKSLKNFYKKTKSERIDDLKEIGCFDDTLNIKADDIVFDHLIENYVTTFEVAMGVAPDFLIDGQTYHIPMATEEPSVIAGASHAAKIIKRNGGFKVESIQRRNIGQIIFKNVTDKASLVKYLNDHSKTWFDLAFKAHPKIHELGGGLVDFKVEEKAYDFVCFYAYINTLDAMGANTINTILESIATYITVDFHAEVLMSILSNLATESLITVSVTINPSHLKNSQVIAKDIEKAYLYASIDPYRAATHNKGIMNGITALMLATGNDTRSVEAQAHAYASITGQYLPLTKWVEKDSMLRGEITLPLAVGTVGGSMGTLPKVRLARKILGVNSALELMKVAASLGLAQNFAAIYALTTDGINKGHMRLHARNVAIEAGALEHQVQDVVNHLLEVKDITLETAKQFLNTLS